jgi:hypothetical protein
MFETPSPLMPNSRDGHYYCNGQLLGVSLPQAHNGLKLTHMQWSGSSPPDGLCRLARAGSTAAIRAAADRSLDPDGAHPVTAQRLIVAAAAFIILASVPAHAQADGRAQGQRQGYWWYEAPKPSRKPSRTRW